MEATRRNIFKEPKKGELILMTVLWSAALLCWLMGATDFFREKIDFSSNIMMLILILIITGAPIDMTVSYYKNKKKGIK